MRINLRIVFEDKTEKEIVCSARDLVAFEAEFDRSVTKLQSEFRLTDLFWLAWHVETRTGATKKSFEDWLDIISSVEASDNDPK